MRKIVTDGITRYEFERLANDGRVVHAVFTRLGGVSAPPYASLNLGRTVGDRVEAVEENHRRALGTLNLALRETASCYQVHGARVGLVGRGHTGTVQPATDALVTAAAGVALLLRFADCAPVLLFAPDVPAVGLAHAGWRGIVAGVVGATVRAMVDRIGCDPARMWAAVGPTIGSCCYEVDAATAAAVARACPDGADVARERSGRPVLDLAAAVRAQLMAAGIAEVEQAGLCTACHVDEFYSHRAEHGHAGRFGVVMGIRA
jgi:YfiH family protein